jgi:dienelactone hydrolase
MPANVDQTLGAERAVPGGRRLALSLHVGRDAVPAVLLTPAATGPGPAALLLHGYTSSKERMLDSIGRALLERGVASLGIDLPLHGERESRLEEESLRNPLVLARQYRAALAECRAALDFLGGRAEVDAARLAVVGYSLGAFLGVIVAAREPSVAAVVLAAGGDLPTNSPFSTLVRAIADPARAARDLRRPLLMIHGRHDRTVTPEQAKRLYAAAKEPKTLLWYDGGHWLPRPMIDRAGEWLAETLGSRVEGLGSRSS